MTLDLEAIKTRAEAALPGPWHWDKADQEANTGEVLEITSSGVAKDAVQWELSTEDGHWVITLGIDSQGLSAMVMTQADAEFVAHARADVADLVAEVERLRALLGAQP